MVRMAQDDDDSKQTYGDTPTGRLTMLMTQADLRHRTKQELYRL
jgi:hypothetical protein